MVRPCRTAQPDRAAIADHQQSHVSRTTPGDRRPELRAARQLAQHDILEDPLLILRQRVQIGGELNGRRPVCLRVPAVLTCLSDEKREPV